MVSDTIRELWGAALDLFYPPRCVACQRSDAWLCQPCIDGSPRVEPPLCIRCGGRRARPLQRLCPRCRRGASLIERTRSPFYFEGPIRTAIHKLKYDGVTALTGPLGGLLADCWLTQSMSGDMIVPVALHRDRRRQRGFNQAALLARELSELVDVPVDEETLVRHRDTASQVGLDFGQRRDNVRDAFRCTRTGLRDERVVLVDDVLTSGATLEACAAALREAGVSRVQALTVARAR